MKTIGMIGGTTWISTIDYYRETNSMVAERCGGDTSAKIILNSVDFAEIRPIVEAHNWDGLAHCFAVIAKQLEAAGADCLVFCANTPHIVAPQVQAAIKIPLLHIVDALALAIKAKGLDTVGLLGTRFTMEQPFYKEKLAAEGIRSIVPDERERAFIHRSIFGELGKNIINPDTKKRYLEIVANLQAQGAQGIVLGCTEIPLLLKQPDATVPLFDTTLIHVKSVVEFALRDDSRIAE